MPIATRRNQTQTYVLDEDRTRPESERTQFTMKMISRRAWLKIKDGSIKFQIMGDGGEVCAMTQIATARLMACRHGLAAWKNFNYADGEPVPFDTIKDDGEIVLSESSLDALLPYSDELGEAILQFNGLSSAELGNSMASPDCSPGNQSRTGGDASTTPNGATSATASPPNPANAPAASAAPKDGPHNEEN